MRMLLVLLALVTTPAQAGTVYSGAHSVPVVDASVKVAPAAPTSPPPTPKPVPAPTPVPASFQWSDVFVPVPAGTPKNRFRVLAGYGPDGYKYVPYGNGYGIQTYYGPLFGFGYERQMWKQISVSFEGLSGAATTSRTLIGIGGVGFGW